MADRYWRGGTGTWNTSSTTNWSDTSGGTGGFSVPTAADNVIFDQAATYTVTMTGALTCLSITVSAGTVTFATGTTPTLAISGGMSLIAGTVWSSTGAITFNSTTAQTITTNAVTINGAITFNGVGGNWSLGSALATGVTLTTTLTNGTLTLNGFNLTTGVFSSNNTFRDVGNNFSGDAGRQVTPIITFNNSSNRSVDDYFNRLTLPMNTVTNYPAIVGPATIDSSINYSALIGSNISTEYTIANFALSNREQLVEINYTMIDEGNSVFSRTGQVTLNITPANTFTGEQVFASASDMFNYAELLPFSSNFVLFSTNYTSHTATNYISLTCWNQLGYDTTSTGLAISTLTNFKIAYQYNILQ